MVGARAARAGSEATLAQERGLAAGHIVPLIGKKKLRDLRAHDVDRMLVGPA